MAIDYPPHYTSREVLLAISVRREIIGIEMTKQMRVAMLSYHTCPLAILGGKDTGGMNVYVRELTRHLGRLGVHVDVYTRSQDEHVPHIIHDLGYGNRVVHVPSGPELPLPREELADHLPGFVKWVINFAKEKNLNYDLIHSHYWMSGLAARDLKKTWDIPIVHMFHTLGLMKNKIAGEGEYEGNYRIHGELEVMKIVDKVIASTLDELSQIQWLYKVKTENITVVPPGVDLNHFYPIPKDEAREYIEAEINDRLLLFVGRIEPLKGIDTLLQALARMKQTGVLDRHEICLPVIGGDASVSDEQMTVEMSRLQSMREELGLDDFVKFLGKKSQASLPYYYSAADILVMPSHYESFGLVALEAMACGTPVVASQVGGLNHLIEDGETGFLVPNQDSEALAEKLTILLDDHILHQRMGQKAVERAKQYAWDIIAPQILDVYNKIVTR